MDSLKDLLQQKASRIDVDAKRDELALCQEIIERYFSSGVKLNKITSNRSVMIKVRNSSLASEVRMQQVVLIEEMNRSLKNNIERIVIRQ